ncbi:hypothetical protein [Microbacterium sp.]|uniref:hypothetical protein n=1 Tax=Microbacterium sp. TaxID=51671 RepID=UPI003F6E53F8
MTHVVALPPGEWIHAATGRAVWGAHEVHVPLDDVPVYVRAGAEPDLLAVLAGGE